MLTGSLSWNAVLSFLVHHHANTILLSSPRLSSHATFKFPVVPSPRWLCTAQIAFYLEMTHTSFLLCQMPVSLTQLVCCLVAKSGKESTCQARVKNSIPGSGASSDRLQS